ncbi:hypothetical protein MBAV_000129, partial [Candidatus Magnetobacterium bavaricum]
AIKAYLFHIKQALPLYAEIIFSGSPAQVVVIINLTFISQGTKDWKSLSLQDYRIFNDIVKPCGRG